LRPIPEHEWQQVHQLIDDAMLLDQPSATITDRASADRLEYQ
jgi:hypothetical protein